MNPSLYRVSETIALSRAHAIRIAKQMRSPHPVPIYIISRRRISGGWTATCEALWAWIMPDGSLRRIRSRHWRPIPV